MLPSPSACSQKNASGRPPVAPKNLRALPSPRVPRIQKSRRAAAPRRSVPGTCRNQPRTLPAYHGTRHAVIAVAVSSAWL
jgi:hypothetical protein